MNFRCAVLVGFVLMGSMTFERLGMENPFGVPERALAALLVLAFVYVPTKVGNHASGRTAQGGSWRPVIGIVVYSMVSLLWATPGPGTLDVAIDLPCVLVLILTTMELIREDARVTVDSLALWLALAGCMYAAVGLSSAGSAARISAFGGGPNVYGRITAIGAMATLHVVMRGRHRWLTVTVPIQLAATILSGSRGAMVALAVSALLMLPVVLRTGAVRKGLVFSSFCILVLVFADEWSGARLSDTMVNRLWRLTVIRRYSSGRDDFWVSGPELFRAHPFFGAGAQGWEAEYGQYLGQAYPHNIVLQFACELGLVGLVLLTLAMLGTVRVQPWARRRGRHPGRPMPSLFASQAAVFCFVGLQFSGGHYDARYLWLFLVVASYPIPVPADPPRTRQLQGTDPGRCRARERRAVTSAPKDQLSRGESCASE